MKSIRTVTKNGTIYYKNEKGYYHKEDGPAYKRINGHKEWYINGLLHREDGPAFISVFGLDYYYLNGKEYSKEDWEEEVLKIKLERIKDL